MFSTTCGRQKDAPAATSLNQPLTESVAQATREAVNERVH